MDKWIKGFENGIGMVCFDKQAKEYVCISNGICVLDHSSTEAFKQSHTEGCVFTPCEAIALRVVGVTETKDPVVAYTYRKVSAEQLEIAKPEDDPVKLLLRMRVLPHRCYY